MIATVIALVVGAAALLLGDDFVSRKIATRTGESPSPRDRMIAIGGGAAAILAALVALFVPGFIMRDSIWVPMLSQVAMVSQDAFDPAIDQQAVVQTIVFVLWLVVNAGWTGMLFGHWMVRRKLTGGRLSIVLPRWVVGMIASVGCACLTVMTLFTATSIVGGAIMFLGSQSQATHYTSSPVSQSTNDETYDGCLALGMSDEEIQNDPETCLLAYWTPDRLKHDVSVHIAWREYQGLPTGCDEDGICRLDGGDGDALPGESHPFWKEQALLKIDSIRPTTDIE